MIEKLKKQNTWGECLEKLNELVDAVNELQHDNSEKANCQENVQPDYVTTSYVTDGRTKEYYGQNEVSVVTDHPLPAGYVITIKEPEEMGYIKLDNDSLQRFLKAHPEYNNNGVIEIPKKAPTDPYAEQRKWIGKLCKFWNDDPNDYVFDKLKEITFAGCYIKESGFIYEYCEPVKPDDDIIYKGE